jgi:cytochrome c biogenesis protein CcdA
MQEILNQIKVFFENAGFGPLAVAASMALGFISAIASSCCTLPLIGALAGYSFTRNNERQSIIKAGLLFMVGLFFSLLVVGAIFVFAGQSIQKISGDYWKIAAGVAAILFGIGALELFPFKLPKISIPLIGKDRNIAGFGVSGIVFGGAIAVSSLPCNPGIFIILGAAVLQKHAIWALVNLCAYALGFSLPLTALVCGLSLGKVVLPLQRAERVIRIIAGIFLIALGIYLFNSF